MELKQYYKLLILSTLLIIVACSLKLTTDLSDLEIKYKVPKHNRGNKPNFIGPVHTEYEKHFQLAVDEISDMINGCKAIKL